MQRRKSPTGASSVRGFAGSEPTMSTDDWIATFETVRTALTKAAGPAAPTPEASPVVIVSADALAAHQSVVNVMDAARRANLPRLTFATLQPANGAAR